jgi:hypothetical protein
MKKAHVLALLCIPLCFTLGFMAPRSNDADGEQEPQAAPASYGFESGYYSMAELGALLERFGQEIQQSGSVTIGGNTYPVTASGGVEINVGPRGFAFEVSQGLTEPPSNGNTYVAFDRGGLQMAPAEFAGFLNSIREGLADTGNFTVDDYSAAVEGPFAVKQWIVARERPGRRTNNYVFDITFGSGEFPVPEDEEDQAAALASGEMNVLAETETAGVNQADMTRMFGGLLRSLRGGQVRVGDQEFAAGDMVDGSISHLIATDGQSQRIRVRFGFGEVVRRPPQPTPPEGPSFSEEVSEIPVNDIAGLLRRIGSEILESRTITFEGVAYTAGTQGGYELDVRNGRLVIELGIQTPPPR